MKLFRQYVAKTLLFIHTLKYLRITQIYYQLFYIVKKKVFKSSYEKRVEKDIKPLIWQDLLNHSNYNIKENTFTFLNRSYKFKKEIDWNFSGYGKLWTYNLNYFDFLNQKNISKNQGLRLIEDYINNDRDLKDGKEPYPISLRGINWIKFLSKHGISEIKINQALYNHYQILLHNLEYHLLGNHLLENGYSLLFGAYYFKDDTLYKKAEKLLTEELNEQVLKDGAHFELSPMYHQIMLHRLLDCINLIENNPWKQKELYLILKEKALTMLSWLKEVTFRNGAIPMVNDSAYDIAPSSQELFRYAANINIPIEGTQLKESGYRMMRNEQYELFVDVGDIMSSYQPGHTHADALNFELYVNNQPFIVDMGTSTYEKNDSRLKERQTASHNTVKIGDYEQSEVWDGFRVARRAKIVELNEGQNYVQATHDGYKKLNILHTRKFDVKDSCIVIHDEISKFSSEKQIAFFHLHPKVDDFKLFDEEIHFPKQSIRLRFKGGFLGFHFEDYEYAIGFNRTKKSKKIVVNFNKELTTKITL